MLCAPLVTREGLLGVLKIAARHPGQFTPHDAELVEHFRSQAAMAIQNLHRTESLRARVVVAERKHAMADLARSVSHDVNNALGAMLPLVQQLQEDLRMGTLEPAGARPGPRAASEVAPGLPPDFRRHAVVFPRFGATNGIRACEGRDRHGVGNPEYGLSRSGIELVLNVPDNVPSVACSQTDLEQVFLNLLTNAREAMPRGGRITVDVRSSQRRVAIAVEDSGCGIPAEDLPRVLEPFFTTKANGSGLGLSICRSILWEVDGTISIRSQTGMGTRVDIALPEAAPNRSRNFHERVANPGRG